MQAARIDPGMSEITRAKLRTAIAALAENAAIAAREPLTFVAYGEKMEADAREFFGEGSAVAVVQGLVDSWPLAAGQS